MRTYFKIVEEVGSAVSKSFLVLETNHTSDGPRTRVCDRMFKTFDEATQDVKRRKELLNAGN